ARTRAAYRRVADARNRQCRPYASDRRVARPLARGRNVAAVDPDAAGPADLNELAAAAGASVRTLQRVFLIETGLGFAQWRQRLRLLQAVTKLSTGASVTQAGNEAGYTSTSAFIAAFRKQLGQTPL